MPSIRIVVSLNKVDISHSTTSYTLGAGVEQSLASVSGDGIVTAVFAGDGDGAFRVRVYVDGSISEEFTTDMLRIGSYSFAKSLEVRIYNPSTASVTASSTSFNIGGITRGVL